MSRKKQAQSKRGRLDSELTRHLGKEVSAELSNLPATLKEELLDRLGLWIRLFEQCEARSDDKGVIAAKGGLKLAVEKWKRNRFPRELAEWLEGALGQGGEIEDAVRRMAGEPVGETGARKVRRIGDQHARQIRRSWQLRQPIPDASDSVIAIRGLIDWCYSVEEEIKKKYLEMEALDNGPAVILKDPNDPPVVLGKTKSLLTGAQYATVKAALDASLEGKRLSMTELDKRSGYADSRKYLAELAKLDSDWKAVIIMARKRGRGYGFNLTHT